MPSLKTSLVLAGALCSLARGFVARPGPVAQVRAHASSTSRPTAAGARQGLHMMSTGYDRVQRAIHDTESSLGYIFENNRKWAAAQDPEMFERLKSSQAPKILYIGCSDSRVPGENLMGLQPGELFVTRNVANVVMNTDFSLLSVLQYSVEVLQVTDIVVCGHYGCGGVKAAMQNKDHGLLEHYLLNIRNVQRLHQKELSTIGDEEARHKRLIELNVKESCMALFANPVVQKKQALDAQPRIHGWVYDISNGRLKDLKLDFKSEIGKFKDIYRLYDFPPQLQHALSADAAAANSPQMISRRAAEPAPVYQPSYTSPPPAEEEPAPWVNGSSSAETNEEEEEKKSTFWRSKKPYKLGL